MRRQALLLSVWLIGALAWVFVPTALHPDGELLHCSRGHRIDLGRVAAGKQLVDFDVTNSSGNIVQIGKVSGSCTCMDVEFGDGRMLPGEVRRCHVTINVQPKASQSTAVFLDVVSPREERLAVLVVYRGVQEDSLRVKVQPELRQLEPDARVELRLTCEWRSVAPVHAEDRVRWNLQDAVGVTLLRSEEEHRDGDGVRSTAVLELDARFRSAVGAIVEVEAGRPVRASERRRFEIPVVASLRLAREVLLVDRVIAPGEVLGEIAVETAPGWTVTAVDTADWLGAELREGRLTVRASRVPPSRRGVGYVTLTASNTEGAHVARRVRCVVDVQE